MRTQCCIVGGGPAGMMAGLLLARAGIDVTVLEKHADFFRDFRGDTIHPSTLQMLHELGLLEEFLRVPHNELTQISGKIGSDVVHIADFDRLPTRCKFIAFMPQWDFLNFLRDHAVKYPTFHLLLQTACTDLIRENGRIVGVRTNRTDDASVIYADLVLGTDGRTSIVREKAGLPVTNLGAPMDVLWMRVEKRPGDEIETLGIAGAGTFLVMIDRKTYWQTAFVFAKGTYLALRQGPIDAIKSKMLHLAPFLQGRLDGIASWDDARLLEVRVDRLERWHAPGVLCIGDAAHAMSPIGGVGVNLALQDAVAAANLLWEPLSRSAVTDADLHAVQRRRTFPMAATQRLQLTIQRFGVRAILKSTHLERAPAVLRRVTRIAVLRRIVGRLIGLGFRPEHIRSPIRAPRPDERPAA